MAEGIAVLALIVSVISIWLQYTVEGPILRILNSSDTQEITPRRYASLPKDVQDKYPYLYVTEDGHALVAVVFGNAGDRNGMVTVKNIKLEVKNSRPYEQELIRGAFEKYVVVPAYQIVEHGIFLRNIPLGAHVIEIEIQLTVEFGGYHHKFGKYSSMEIIEETLKVKLLPGVGKENDPPRVVTVI